MAILLATQIYSVLFRVSQVDTVKDVVAFEDCNGNRWEWKEADDIEVGDYFTAVMCDNGTAEITDDSILSIRFERVDLFEEGRR